MFVGDFGNNMGARDDLKIYTFSVQGISDGRDALLTVDTISFEFADQTDFSIRTVHDFDCEAMFATERYLYLFSKGWETGTTRQSMRNTNISRNIGISTTMGHELLCKTLMKHWNKLTEYFGAKTKEQSRIISRIHIRKMQEGEDLLCLCAEVLFFCVKTQIKEEKVPYIFFA